MRIFYCPKHGKVTEPLFKIALEYGHLAAQCDQCRAWYHQKVKYKAKRQGES